MSWLYGCCTEVRVSLILNHKALTRGGSIGIGRALYGTAAVAFHVPNSRMLWNVKIVAFYVSILLKLSLH